MTPAEKKEVAGIILRFVEDRDLDVWEWGEYLSIAENDPELEEIRLRCSAIRDQYPPLNEADYCNEDGMKQLRQIAEKLLSNGNGSAS